MEQDSPIEPTPTPAVSASTLVLAVALLGTFLSFHSFHSVREAERETLQAATEREVAILRVTLKERLNNYRSTLWSVRQLTRWMGSTNHLRFAEVAQGFLNRVPEVRAIELSPYIPAQHRNMFESAAIASGLDDFRIWRKGTDGEKISVPDAGHYLPIYYAEPLEGNRDALGLDLLHTVNSNVIDRCRDTGRMCMSGPIRLSQDPEQLPAVIFYAPRYRGQVPRSDPPEILLAKRRQNFAGVVQVVVRTSDLLNELVQALNLDGMDIALADRAAPETLLYYRSAPTRKTPSPQPTLQDLWSQPHHSSRLRFSGRTLHLICCPSPAYIADHLTNRPLTTLIAGLSFTGMIIGFIVVLSRRSRLVDELVVDRTEAFFRSQKMLIAGQARLQKVNSAIAELPRLISIEDGEHGPALRSICETTALRFDLNRLSIWLFDTDRQNLRCENLYEPASDRHSSGALIDTATHPRYIAALENDRLISAVNARRDLRTEELLGVYLEPMGVYSRIDAPIRKGGRLLGVICGESVGRHRRWTREEETFALALADTVALLFTEEESQLANERLRSSERFHQSLVAHLPHYVFRKDLAGRFTFVNERMAQTWTGPDMIGLTGFDIAPRDLAMKYQAGDQQVIRTGETLEFVEECDPGDGERMILHTTKSPIRDDSGTVIGLQGISIDISERYRLQAALSASDERFRVLIENLDCVAWEGVPDGIQFTYVSQQAEKILGYPPAVFIDDANFWLDHVHENDRATARSEYQQAIEQATDRQFDCRMIDREGAVLWLRNLISVELDSLGKPVRLRGLMINISESRKLLHEVRESREQMTLFIEHTPTSVAMFDRDMNYLIASRRWYEDNGLEGDIVGKQHYDLIPEIPERWRQIHRECLAGATNQCEEDPFRRADGSLDWVRWEIHPWHEGNGAIGGIVMFSETITDRVNARLDLERSQAILQATGRSAEVFLKATDWQEAVPQILSLLGKATGAERICLFENTRDEPNHTGRFRFDWQGENAPAAARDSVSDIDWTQPALAGWVQGFEQGDPITGPIEQLDAAALNCLRREGLKSTLILPLRVENSWFGVLCFDKYSSACTSNESEYFALRGAADNLAAAIERDHAQQEKLFMERKLHEGQRLESLGVLAGGIAHDFNNLLTAIIGNAGLARLDAGTDSGIRQSIDTIERTALRAADLCKQMLAYAGKGRFEMHALDLNALAGETIELLKVSISKKITLDLDLFASLPAVRADKSQMSQIIMNLVINASEAIGDGVGRINLTTATRHLDRSFLSRAQNGGNLEPGNYILLSVADTGSGMDEATLARVFEPFFTTKFTGRGLGLAAVLGIVSSHDGALHVRSGEGEGTRFTLILPRFGESPLPASLSDGESEKLEDLSNVKNRRVLLVDDEDDVRDVAEGVLKSLGVEVVTARDGQEGVDRYRSQSGDFDLVLMDLTMPRLGGLEAFFKLRKLDPQVKVLLMSGYDEKSAALEFADQGLIGFLRKPFQVEELRELVAEKLRATTA
jgi:PAS domain S-box-containing protein